MVIRPAILDDSAAILALRNHPESVFWSGQPRINETAHEMWWPSHVHTVLVLADSMTVHGYARVAEDGRVSLAVSASMREHGYGRQLILALEGIAKTPFLYALVHPSNVASMRAFMHSGYALDHMDGIFQIVRKHL